MCSPVVFVFSHEKERHRQKERERAMQIKKHLGLHFVFVLALLDGCVIVWRRGGGLGSRPKKMYGERLGDGVEYHLMSPTPRR